MKRIFLTLVVFCLLARAETLELTNGKKAEVRLLKAEEAGARIEFNGAVRVVPWSEIKSIDWPVVPEETAAMDAVGKGAPLVRVMDLWVAKKPWLARPNSDAGTFGLFIAAQLAKRSLAEERTRARELFEVVFAQDWNPARRDAALLGRMQMDLAEGKLESVAAEIAKLPSTASVGLLVDARYALATANALALGALEKEHPKWEQEDDVLPKRTALFNRTVDDLLYPVLFHGADESRCRRNLQSLVQFYKNFREPAAAEATQRDLERLYPQKGAATP